MGVAGGAVVLLAVAGSWAWPGAVDGVGLAAGLDHGTSGFAWDLVVVAVVFAVVVAVAPGVAATRRLAAAVCFAVGLIAYFAWRFVGIMAQNASGGMWADNRLDVPVASLQVWRGISPRFGPVVALSDAAVLVALTAILAGWLCLRSRPGRNYWGLVVPGIVIVGLAVLDGLAGGGLAGWLSEPTLAGREAFWLVQFALPVAGGAWAAALPRRKDR
jgi:hypothetical protein